ncbi:hypothetical protein GGR57DRAFT_154370 [Xylariaceae sp. FL1272]|nr:hypothetical protein GGR57DRAFT_154370 [Xylariaceae sp. FL1272]
MPDPNEPLLASAQDDARPCERFMTLAGAMVVDDNLAVVRRFGDLNMVHLLNLQTELEVLRRDFRKVYQVVNQQTPNVDVFRYLSDGFAQQESKKGNDSTRPQNEKLKKELYTEIRKKMKEYNETLLIEMQLRNLDPPEPEDISYLRAWISPDIGGRELEEVDRDCWSEEFNNDFVSLKNPEWRQNQILSRMKLASHIVQYKLWGFKSASSSQIDSNVIKLGSEKGRVGRSTLRRKSAFSSRLAMALFGGIALIVPTIIMALHQSVQTCLITTSVATVVFAVILAFGARDATGKDVLAATAAYTAVLVVFLGSSVSGDSGGTAAPG